MKDDHLVITDTGAGEYTVAAIDFASALSWGDPNGPVEAASPPALVSNPDKQVVAATVEKIEQVTDATIDSIVHAIPDETLPPNEKQRISAGLKSRRPRVREAMHQKGWMP